MAAYVAGHYTYRGQVSPGAQDGVCSRASLPKVNTLIYEKTMELGGLLPGEVREMKETDFFKLLRIDKWS